MGTGKKTIIALLAAVVAVAVAAVALVAMILSHENTDKDLSRI